MSCNCGENRSFLHRYVLSGWNFINGKGKYKKAVKDLADMMQQNLQIRLVNWKN